MVVSWPSCLAAATSSAGASANAGATIANSATEAAPASAIARGEAEGCDAGHMTAAALLFISPIIDLAPGCLPVVIY